MMILSTETTMTNLCNVLKAMHVFEEKQKEKEKVLLYNQDLFYITYCYIIMIIFYCYLSVVSFHYLFIFIFELLDH